MEGYVITIHKVDGPTPDAERVRIFEQLVETLDIHKFISALNVKPRKPRTPKVKA